MARRFGSAMISNTDSTLLIYSTEHMRVKAYTSRGPRQRFQSACGDAPSDAFLAGAIQSAARSGQVSLDEAEHFPAQSRSRRRYAPMVFGIILECRSASLRNERSASPESPK
jgi:hypothetical protein